jgi:hypothetical protein
VPLSTERNIPLLVAANRLLPLVTIDLTAKLLTESPLLAGDQLFPLSADMNIPALVPAKIRLPAGVMQLIYRPLPDNP